ncbi:MAG TPA: hypothetical protein VGL19_14265 [Polyangiaceae bacterium]|jgi:hypothetical protein
MNLTKLSTLLVVDAIEPCLPTWQALGYAVTVRVPEAGPAVFTILAGPSAEIMLQTRASLAEDLPAVAARNPTHLLYADVASLAEAARALASVTVLVPQRKTFYGANEIWLELPGGMILGLAEHA